MKWTNDRSDNVEDRRGKGGGRGMMIGGGLGTIVMVLVVMFLGGDPLAVLNNSGVMQGQAQTEQRQLTEEELKTYEFVRMVTAETEETWTEIFEEHGLEYSIIGKTKCAKNFRYGFQFSAGKNRSKITKFKHSLKMI